MIPFAILEQHLKHLSEDKIEVILEVRNIVSGICPDAVERLDRRGIVYYDAKRGGPVKGGICFLLFEPDHIRLDFAHGAFLPDPANLIKGDNLAKRGLKLGEYDTIPWEEITDLIHASANFDPTSFSVNQKH